MDHCTVCNGNEMNKDKILSAWIRYPSYRNCNDICRKILDRETFIIIRDWSFFDKLKGYYVDQSYYLIDLYGILNQNFSSMSEAMKATDKILLKNGYRLLSDKEMSMI